MGRKHGNNPDDYEKSWTDPPFFVDQKVYFQKFRFL